MSKLIDMDIRSTQKHKLLVPYSENQALNLHSWWLCCKYTLEMTFYGT